MTAIYLASFVLEVVKYLLVYEVGFSKKISKISPLVFVGMLYFALLAVFDLRTSEANILITVFTAASMLFCVAGRAGRRVLEVLIVFFAVTWFDELLDTLVIDTFIIIKKLTVTNELEHLANSWISVLVILTIFFVKKRCRHLLTAPIAASIKKGMKIFIIIMGCGIFFTIEGLNYAGEVIDNEKFSLFAAIMSIVSFLSTGMTGILMLYINRIHEGLEKQSEVERQLNTMQKIYYEALLEKEEDTRRYRHDMTNHLISLSGIAADGDLPRVRAYIAGMQDKMIEIQNKAYCTGCDVLDILLSYYSGLLDDDTVFRVRGRCMGELAINEIDLCTVFSNLLRNAAEELSKGSGENKFLKMDIVSGNGSVRFAIRNSGNSRNWEPNFRFTTKADKKNHGFGLGNVKSAVEKNGGELCVLRKPKEFTVSVTLKYQQ